MATKNTWSVTGASPTKPNDSPTWNFSGDTPFEIGGGAASQGTKKSYNKTRGPAHALVSRSFVVMPPNMQNQSMPATNSATSMRYSPQSRTAIGGGGHLPQQNAAMYGQPQVFDRTKQSNQLPSPQGFDLAQLLAQANAQYQQPAPTPTGQMARGNDGRMGVAPVGWNGPRVTSQSSYQPQYRSGAQQQPTNRLGMDVFASGYNPNQARGSMAGTGGTFTPDYQAQIRGGYQDTMRQQAQAIERARILQQQQPNDEIARVMQLNRYL